MPTVADFLVSTVGSNCTSTVCTGLSVCLIVSQNFQTLMLIAVDRCTWCIILQELVWNSSSFAAWVVNYPLRILASFVRWVLDIVWLKRVLVNFLVVWSHAQTVVAIFIFSDWVALLTLLYFRVLELFKRHRWHKCSSCIRPSMRRDRVSCSLLVCWMPFYYLVSIWTLLNCTGRLTTNNCCFTKVLFNCW